MRVLIAAAMAIWVLAGSAFAADPPSCALPDYLVLGDKRLRHVTAAVRKDRRLSILVFGSASSTLAGPSGTDLAYPARLEVALTERLPGIEAKVAIRAKGGQTTDEMKRGMKQLLIDAKPDLVIWQTGTVDAIRRVETDDFRTALEQGVEALRAGGADVVLMNMQYSPRTETMIAVSRYADTMRALAHQQMVPLFDRFAIMRYWADHGSFDFYASGRDNGLARRVHDCIGRALAKLIIEAGRLAVEPRPVR